MESFRIEITRRGAAASAQSAGKPVAAGKPAAAAKPATTRAAPKKPASRAG
jgi:hypothetical protein